jgi:hypothetical protein
VKSRKIILSVSSALMALFFLAGTTGITLIIHNCPVCDKYSAHAGIFLSPSEPEDDCCEAAGDNCTSENNTSMESACCHFKIQKLGLTTSYAPAIPLLISAPAEMPLEINLSDNYEINHSIALPLEIHNKHGGRYLLTYNCQLKS